MPCFILRNGICQRDLHTTSLWKGFMEQRKSWDSHRVETQTDCIEMVEIQDHCHEWSTDKVWNGKPGEQHGWEKKKTPPVSKMNLSELGVGWATTWVGAQYPFSAFHKSSLHILTLYNRDSKVVQRLRGWVAGEGDRTLHPTIHQPAPPLAVCFTKQLLEK